MRIAILGEESIDSAAGAECGIPTHPIRQLERVIRKLQFLRMGVL